MNGSVLFGVPSSLGFREITSEGGDHEHAPQAMRDALKRYLEGYDIPLPFRDDGDLDPGASVSQMLDRIQAKTESILKAGQRAIILGGAHTITLGAIRGIAKTLGKFSLIYVDAHPDIMPRAEVDYGSTLYHGISEGSLAAERIAFVGIRKVERPEAKVISERKIAVYSTQSLTCRGISAVAQEIRAKFPPPYFFSLDLDGIDPTYAPAVSCPCPVGVQPAEVLALFEALKSDIRAVDIVELCPRRDTNLMTTKLAAALLLQFGEMLQS